LIITGEIPIFHEAIILFINSGLVVANQESGFLVDCEKGEFVF